MIYSLEMLERDRQRLLAEAMECTGEKRHFKQIFKKSWLREDILFDPFGNIRWKHMCFFHWEVVGTFHSH